MMTDELSDDDRAFIERLEQRTASFDAWQARRAAARSKLIELGLTGDEVDAVLNGPTEETPTE